MSSAKHEVPVGFGHMVPMIAQDLLCEEATMAWTHATEQATWLLARRQTRVFLVYWGGGVLRIGALVGGIWAGAWLTGLPLVAGPGLRQSYPLDFMISRGMEPWG